MPWSRNTRSRVAQRSSKSACDSVCTCSYSDAVVEPRVAGRVEHLVPRVDRLVRVEEIAHRAHLGAAADLRRVPPMKQRYRITATFSDEDNGLWQSEH